MGNTSILVRLAKIDTCSLSDALDRLGIAGAATGLHSLSGAGRIAGRAITVKLGVGDPPPGPVRHLVTAAVDLAGEDNVIVVEQRSGVEAAGWGGLLTVAAKIRKVGGTIVDGPARDIDEAIDHGYRLFARQATCRTARGRIVEFGTQVPVTVGDVAVEPDDYVVADSSGIVFIKPDRVDEVLELAEYIARREALMADALADGSAVAEVMGRDYETMLQAQS